ncbi:hypothetical protein [Kitasatospora viridis]|uniref:hypothetical protein n=1 Tax=Kitasatospora viridis TaxID=281105 RepID=UPI0011A4B2EC|nr:hypothetical protein [Kitasatospora viridis]
MRAALLAVTGHWAGGPRTLDSLCRSWRDAVAAVADGYSWSAPELTHDIWCRTGLARVWPLLPPRVRALRQRELDESDDRFREVTVPWPDQVADRGEWWMRRIPRLLDCEPEERLDRGWPTGWEMMPFPRPDGVELRY